MIHFRGSDLRASTLLKRGYLALILAPGFKSNRSRAKFSDNLVFILLMHKN